MCEIFILVDLLEHTHNYFLWAIFLLVAKNTVSPYQMLSGAWRTESTPIVDSWIQP